MSFKLLLILPILLISTEIVLGQDAAPAPAPAPKAAAAPPPPAAKPTQKENEAKGD